MGEDRRQYMVTSEGWLIDAQSGVIISKEPGAVPPNMGPDDIFRTQDPEMPVYSQSYGYDPSQLTDYTTRNTPVAEPVSTTPKLDAFKQFRANHPNYTPRRQAPTGDFGLSGGMDNGLQNNIQRAAGQRSGNPIVSKLMGRNKYLGK